jgi:ribosomal protein L36
MKVRASVKREVPSAKLCVEKGDCVINKKNPRFKQRQGYYGKNSRVDIRKTREVL